MCVRAVLQMRKWLEAHTGARLLVLEDTVHAGFLMDHGAQASIVAHVEHMLRARRC